LSTEGEIDIRFYSSNHFLAEPNLIKHYRNSNELGKDEAIKRVEELTFMGKYKNKNSSMCYQH
jgi:hypothetical protein